MEAFTESQEHGTATLQPGVQGVELAFPRPLLPRAPHYKEHRQARRPLSPIPPAGFDRVRDPKQVVTSLFEN